MKNALTGMVLCALLAFYSLPARATELTPFEFSQPGDLQLSCNQISKEVAAMQSLIEQADTEQQSSRMTATGVTVAKTVGSYLVGSLAGGIGILAAGYIVSEATDDRAEDAVALRDSAEQRRSFMAGIYNARGCNGPLEYAGIEPAAGNQVASPEPVKRKRRYND